MSSDTTDLSLFNVDYTLDDGQAVLHAMCRDPANPRVRRHISINGFIPYFYIHGENTRSGATEIRRMYRDPRYLTSLVGEPVTKVETFTPPQVRDLRLRDFRQTQTYQSKVLFPNNFLATTGIKSGIVIPSRTVGMINYESLIANNSIYVEPLTTILDIEVDNSAGGFPAWRKPLMPITMTTAIDTYTNKLYTFAWHPKRTNDEIKSSIYHFKYSNIDVPWKAFLYTEEYPMLCKLVDYLTNVQQDIITGWNVHFDITYILARCKELNIDTSGISPIGKTFISKYGDANIGCVAVLDMLECYKSLTKFTGMKDSFKLGDVGSDELKLTKLAHQGSVGQFWIQQFKKSVMYNIRDVEICWELNKRLKIMRYFDIQRRQVGCTYGDVMSTKRIIEMDQLRAAMAIGKVLPSYDKDDTLDDDDDDIEGAYVFPPTIGVFDHVLAFDLKSLYPSIIQTLNISPETRIDPDLYTAEQLKQFIRSSAGHYYRKDIIGFAKDRLIAFNKDRDKFKSCTLLISKIQKAIDKMDGTTIAVLPMIAAARSTIDEYDVEKASKFADSKPQKKKLPADVIKLINQMIDNIVPPTMTVDSLKQVLDSEKTTYDLMQMAEKAKINTWYGVMGHEGSALYNPADAESVTLTGQEIIKFTATISTSPELRVAIKEKFGLDIEITVLYGDTDSIILKGLQGIADGKIICKIADFIAMFMNSKYDAFCVEHFNTDPGMHYLKNRCEKIAKRFMMAPKRDSDEGGKKRYAYLPWFELKGDEEWVENTKNEVVIVGFESKRSNIAKIGRIVQKKVIELVLFQKPRAMIRAVVLDVAEKFQKRTIPLEFLTTNISLKEINEYKAVIKHPFDRSSWPIHVRAAQYGIEYLNQQWNAGDKVKCIYVSRCPSVYPPTEVVAIDGDEVPRGFEVDYHKIHEKQVEAPLDSILRAINWTYIDLKTGSSQAKI